MSSSEAQRGSSTLESPHPTATANGRTFGPGRALRQGAKVLPEHARGHNRSLLLQTLFHQGAMSRADLSRETGLTRVTISDLVAELIADGFVVEKGVREASGPGKPAILVDLDRDGSPHRRHRPVGQRRLHRRRAHPRRRHRRPPRGARSPPPTMSSRPSSSSLASSSRDSHAPVLGIGVGTPGVVDDHGVILTARNFGWAGFDLEGALQSALGLPVLVANDANAAVLAEYTFGGAGDDVLLVKVGRGVGSGLLAAGQPMRGSRTSPRVRSATSPSAPTAARSACAARSDASRPGSSVPALSARLAAAADDADARDGILRDAGERLGIALAPIVGVLDLSEIVLSGPPELLDGPLAEATVETLRARTLAEFHDGVRVRMTEQGQDIVLRGAAVMVLSGQLGVS